MRIKIVIIIVLLTLILYYIYSTQGKVHDFARICYASPCQILTPTTEDEIDIVGTKAFVICIAGARYSHGGQTMCDNALYLDMRKFNRITVDKNNRLVTAQAGATWYQIQQKIDPLGLSVAEMQSYANFSVGGSISVNAHGRGGGTVGDTIVSMDVMLSDGTILREVTRDHRNTSCSCSKSCFATHELFKAIVGGYGGIAIILSVTLHAVPNVKIKRVTRVTNVSDFQVPNTNSNEGKFPESVVFYNGNIYPTIPDQLVNVYWIHTNNDLTVHDKLQKHNGGYFLQMCKEQLLRRFDTIKFARAVLEPEKLAERQVVWRNYEMSYDTGELEPLLHVPSTTVLQEYFVPPNRIQRFLRDFWRVVREESINILNVSLRFVRGSRVSLLSYAPEDRVAIVLYINIWNNSFALDHVKHWTRLLVELSLSCGGTFYLPYLQYATREQFRRGYPRYREYLAVKKKYDPENRLHTLQYF